MFQSAVNYIVTFKTLLLSCKNPIQDSADCKLREHWCKLYSLFIRTVLV